MKKLFLMGFVALGLASCVSDKEVKSQTESDLLAQKQEAYSNAFVQKFGNIAPNQTWGFKSGVRAATTMRTANTNGNQWEDQDWVIPADITDSELQAVLAVFNEEGAESYESLIDLNDFFVQQVYKGEASYYNHSQYIDNDVSKGLKPNEQPNVIGSQHMDWLCTVTDKKVEVVNYYPYEEKVVITDSYDDHINNFNNGNCTSSWTSEKTGIAVKNLMLMVNSNTNKFGFKSSEDNGHVFYNFRMEKINGNYYVGFDFEANGNNPNEKVDRDYIYNDWIVKIVPGKGQTDKVKEEGMIICEDLGNIGDFDFNDVVFYAKVWESGKTDIWLLAAGGTLDLTVAGREVHEAFGVSKSTMVNTMESTGKGAEKPIVYFQASQTYNSLIDIPIVVTGKDAAGNVTSYELSAEMGKAPQKICVPKGFKWCKEYKSLAEVYPGFKDWTTGAADTWAGSYDAENVCDYDFEY